jgi:hypothetical protein
VEPVLAVVVVGWVVTVGTGLQSTGFVWAVHVLRRCRSPVPKSECALV